MGPVWSSSWPELGVMRRLEVPRDRVTRSARYFAMESSRRGKRAVASRCWGGEESGCHGSRSQVNVVARASECLMADGGGALTRQSLIQAP